MLTNLLVESGARLVYLSREFILVSDYLANVEYQFLFDSVRVLANFQRCWHELVLRELYAKTLS